MLQSIFQFLRQKQEIFADSDGIRPKSDGLKAASHSDSFSDISHFSDSPKFCPILKFHSDRFCAFWPSFRTPGSPGFGRILSLFWFTFERP